MTVINKFWIRNVCSNVSTISKNAFWNSEQMFYPIISQLKFKIHTCSSSRIFRLYYLIYRLLTTGRQQIIFTVVAMLQTAEMEHKLLLDLVHWTLSVWDIFMHPFLVYMRFDLTPYKALHYISDLVGKQVSERSKIIPESLQISPLFRFRIPWPQFQ